MDKKNLPAVSAENDSSPPALLKMAISQNIDIDKLERLMALNERWQKEQARKAFLTALAEFQILVPELTKTKTANITGKEGRAGYSYKYADLGGIRAQIKKPLQKCGLSFRWEFKEEAGLIAVTCLLSHKEGHTEATTMSAARDDSGGKNAIQQKGSTLTYLQRYSLIGALGISTADSDDDAKGAGPAVKKTAPPPKKVLAKSAAEDPEYLAQWKSEVKNYLTRASLHSLYLKNKAAVDADVEIQKIFKAHQDTLPATPTTKPQMP